MCMYKHDLDLSCFTEALVVSGLYTLKTVMYRAEFDRDGSPELRDLIAVLAGEVRMAI